MSWLVVEKWWSESQLGWWHSHMKYMESQKKIMYKHVPKHQPNVSIEWHISHVYRRGFQDSISGTYPKCDYWVDVHSWTNRLDTNVSGLQNTIWLFFIPWVGWHFKTIRRILLSKIQYLWIYLAQFKQYIQIYKGWYMSKSRLYSSAFWCIFSKDLPPYSSSAIYGSPSWGFNPDSLHVWLINNQNQKRFFSKVK